MLDSRVQSQNERQCDSRGLSWFLIPLENKIPDKHPYSIRINPILSSSPSNLGQSFPIPALHHLPSYTVSFDFVTKALALPYSSNLLFFPSESPKKLPLPSFLSSFLLHTHLLMLIGFL